MDARERFLAAADKIGEGTDCWAHLVAEPWPDWLLKVLLRLSRVFTPELKAADLHDRPERFHGLLAGSLAQLAKLVDELDMTEIGDDSPFAFLKAALPKMRDVESAAIQETLAAAYDLPGEQHAEFFSAFGSALEMGTAFNSMERMADSPTVKVCLFLLFLRPQIDAGQFRSVSELGSAPGAMLISCPDAAMIGG